jgi:adenylyltransferase/sulfurtransferase
MNNLLDVLSGKLLLFDGSIPRFQIVKLRNRILNCDICGENPKIRELIDYQQFCGGKPNDKPQYIQVI